MAVKDSKTMSKICVQSKEPWDKDGVVGHHLFVAPWRCIVIELDQTEKASLTQYTCAKLDEQRNKAVKGC